MLVAIVLELVELVLVEVEAQTRTVTLEIFDVKCAESESSLCPDGKSMRPRGVKPNSQHGMFARTSLPVSGSNTRACNV